MTKRGIATFSALYLLVFVGISLSAAQEVKEVKLPEPQTDNGMPLMRALKARQSIRSYGPEQRMPMQTLSNLLWAANGVSRSDGRRTAPSAMNWQNIDVYVATADGLYVYDAPKNALKVILTQDVRGETGMQDFVKSVPVDLVYVADYSKIKTGAGAKIDAGSRDVWSAAGVGFISQNVYLFCASEGLATVVRGMFNQETLSKVLKLNPEQKIMLTQSIGYPKK